MIYFLIACKIFECHFNKNVDSRFKCKYALSLNHKRIILTIQVIKIAPLRHIYCYVVLKSSRSETFITTERWDFSCIIKINMPFCSEYDNK